MSWDVDVTIVGCGPVGATLAVALGRRGVTVLAVERETSIYHLPRAASFDGEALRMFQALGLADQIARRSIPLRAFRYESERGDTLAAWDLPDDQSGSQAWGDAYLFHQPEVEAMLRAAMAALPTVELSTGVEAIGIDQTSAGATVTVQPVGGMTTRSLSSQYVVGCDGGASFVRRAIGSRFENLGPEQDWVVIDGVERRPLGFTNEIVGYCWPQRPHMFMVKPPPRLRWEFLVRPDDDRDRIVTADGAYDLVERFVSPDDVEIERCAIYAFHSLLAERWRDRRVFLAGDAAHLQPPLRGQGLCSGIRDVMNLSWKLAAVIRGDALDDLLETYESERRPNAEAWINIATELSAIINTTDPAVAAERDAHLLANPIPYSNDALPLGPGLHPASSRLGGSLSNQAVHDDRRLDNGSRGRFTVAMTRAINAQLSADARAALADAAWFEVLPIGSHAADAVLARHGGPHALVIRPDRYVLGAADDAAELERVLHGWLRFTVAAGRDANSSTA